MQEDNQEKLAREKRQLVLMRERLGSSPPQLIRMNKLLVDLRSLVGQLQVVDDVWKEEFHLRWWILEEVYAYALYKGKEEFDPGDRETVESAIEQLRLLVDSKLAEPLWLEGVNDFD